MKNNISITSEKLSKELKNIGPKLAEKLIKLQIYSKQNLKKSWSQKCI